MVREMDYQYAGHLAVQSSLLVDGCRLVENVETVVSVVYIPTKNRPANVRRVVPAWLDQGIPVRLVLDHEDISADLRARAKELWGDEVHLTQLPAEMRGLGAIRNYIVRDAHSFGRSSIIFAEDDVVPTTDNFGDLLGLAAHPKVLGIGATQSLHDWFTGGKIKDLTGPILCPGGWGFILFGLNVENALKVGNYDPKLYADGDDAELARNGIANGFPWLVHCDIRYASIGKQFAEGGNNSQFGDINARLKAEEECHALIHSRWPKYISAPGKRYRQSWNKMLTDYLPSWKEWSALHGGSLEGYLQ